jgi:hypothetical protein
VELASAAVAGTVSGLGSEFIHFSSITFDPGSQWSLEGITRGLAGVISGFAPGDTITLDGVTATGSNYVGGVLTLEETSGSATLDLPGTFALGDFQVTNVAAGTEVTVACFLAGTRILTETGERAVEELLIGDRVITHSGEAKPIKWIGHRHIDCKCTSAATDVWPVRVCVGAFNDILPHRDLLLSPDHAVFIDGALVPIRYLINGATILQQAVPEVTYFHVELPAHDVILAEGLPAESYLDSGNRAAFGAMMTSVSRSSQNTPPGFRRSSASASSRSNAALLAPNNRLAAPDVE